MVRELSVQEQKYQAVMAVLSDARCPSCPAVGAPGTQVACGEGVLSTPCWGASAQRCTASGPPRPNVRAPPTGEHDQGGDVPFSNIHAQQGRSNNHADRDR